MQLIGNFYFPDADTHFQEWQESVGLEKYQIIQRNFALTFVTDFRTALDAGAHVGIFSRHFSAHFDEVLAFEPVPEVRECLERNAPKNVIVRKEALSDEAGYLCLRNDTPDNSGNAFLDHRLTDGLFADVIRIDDLNLSNLGLLKIDVQGEDFKVLAGARKTIRRCKTVVMIEEKPLNSDGSTDHIDKIARFMEANGATRQKKLGADRVYTFD